MADGLPLILQMLKGIESRLGSIEGKVERGGRDYVPRELFTNLVAEVDSLDTEVQQLKATLHRMQNEDSKNSGRMEVIGKLTWPLVATLIAAFAAWLGLGPNK